MILNEVDLGRYALPEFQRGYVWNRDQVRKLMYALYRGYPIGSLLVWLTSADGSIVRGGDSTAPGIVNLILDGQQRITTLYGIIRGEPPKFFEGNPNTFQGLHFNLKDETFEFYSPQKMRGNPDWINVTTLMKEGAGNYIARTLAQNPLSDPTQLQQLFDKLNRINNIKDIDLHIEEVAGSDKTVDVVVDIFNNVNSGVTKLYKSDLALAKICGQWPEARDSLKNIQSRYARAGYSFKMEWLLRCVTVYLTGRPYFSGLDKVNVADFQEALHRTDQLIGTCLDHIGSRLGLDHDNVLGGRYAMCTMIGYLHMRGDAAMDSKEWDRLLYWYIHCFLWGRYAGSVESIMAQDLNALAEGKGIEGLLHLLRQNRANLHLTPDNFVGWSTGSRFYPLLYMLTRVGHSRDFASGIELTANLLGRNSSLEVHHIFPKDLLYRKGWTRSYVNALANYAFITKDTNLKISNRMPEEYLAEYAARTPGAIESHWIPNDPALWKLDNYESFLAKRRELLAEAANRLLDSLYMGEGSDIAIEDYANRRLNTASSEAGADSEAMLVREIAAWMQELGLDAGSANHELIDAQGETLEILDLAWPDGVQTGLSEPIALLFHPDARSLRIANQCGYRCFSDVRSFKQHILENYAPAEDTEE